MNIKELLLSTPWNSLIFYLENATSFQIRIGGQKPITAQHLEYMNVIIKHSIYKNLLYAHQVNETIYIAKKDICLPHSWPLLCRALKKSYDSLIKLNATNQLDSTILGSQPSPAEVNQARLLSLIKKADDLGQSYAKEFAKINWNFPIGTDYWELLDTSVTEPFDVLTAREKIKVKDAFNINFLVTFIRMTSTHDSQKYQSSMQAVITWIIDLAYMNGALAAQRNDIFFLNADYWLLLPLNTRLTICMPLNFEQIKLVYSTYNQYYVKINLIINEFRAHINANYLSVALQKARELGDKNGHRLSKSDNPWANLRKSSKEILSCGLNTEQIEVVKNAYNASHRNRAALIIKPDSIAIQPMLLPDEREKETSRPYTQLAPLAQENELDPEVVKLAQNLEAEITRRNRFFRPIDGIRQLTDYVEDSQSLLDM